MSGNRLIIGLDYGTTYTGVSFGEASENDLQGKHVNVINNWPSRNTKIGTKEKVPSEVTYQPEGIVWGSLIAPNVKRHMWTKLQLESHQVGEAVKIKEEMSSIASDLQKRPEDIVADFLAQVKTHLIECLNQKYGQALWRTLPIKLVITVPAVWSDSAKNKTLQAVNKAGFNSLEFAQTVDTVVTTEPESAAIYTIKSMHGTAQDTQFSVGDSFILCDMGGGTVDLISYRIASLEPTEIEEVTVGGGDQCGGTVVDRAFIQWLERRLGTKDFMKIAECRSEEVPRTSLSKKAARMLQDFSLEAKSGFSGIETNYIRLPPPLSGVNDDEVRGIVDGEIMIKPEDMEDMFSKSVCRTYELITEQMKRLRKSKKLQVKYIFLVGGFSESPYMYNKIKAYAANIGLVTIKPNYAWSAVVRGAFTKGMEGDSAFISKRKCRRHYGTSFCAVFNKKKHDESDSYISRTEGIKRARGQMDWLLKKGQDLPTLQKVHAVTHLFENFFPGERRLMTLRLLSSDIGKAPIRDIDEGVYTVAKVDVDLSVVPKKYWEAMLTPSGQLYHRLNYVIQISLQSTLEFSLQVNGKAYGSLTAKYE